MILGQETWRYLVGAICFFSSLRSCLLSTKQATVQWPSGCKQAGVCEFFLTPRASLDSTISGPTVHNLNSRISSVSGCTLPVFLVMRVSSGAQISTHWRACSSKRTAAKLKCLSDVMESRRTYHAETSRSSNVPASESASKWLFNLLLRVFFRADRRLRIQGCSDAQCGHFKAKRGEDEWMRAGAAAHRVPQISGEQKPFLSLQLLELQRNFGMLGKAVPNSLHSTLRRGLLVPRHRHLGDGGLRDRCF